MTRRFALVFLLTLIAGCSSPTETASVGEEGRVLGAIEHYNDPVRLEIPGSATQGDSIVVTVVTYGGGCVDKGETEVEVNGSHVLVSPYDYDVRDQVPADAACTDLLYQFEHEARIRFDRPGTATVVIRGQRKPSGEIISVERSIEIR